MAPPTHANQEEQAHDLDPAAKHGHAPPEADQVSNLLLLLDPGDFQDLAKLLRGHPQLREQIIQQATELLGSHVVGQALALLALEDKGDHAQDPAAGPVPSAQDRADNLALLADANGLDPKTGQPLQDPADVRGPAPSKDEQADDLAMLADVNGLDPKTGEPLPKPADVRGPAPSKDEQADNLALLANVNGLDPKTGEPLPGQQQGDPATVIGPVPSKEVQEDNLAMLAEVNGIDPTTVEKAPEAAAEKEPGWVTRARTFNAGHSEMSAQFDELTGHQCLTDGELDPRKISDWQAEHGVPPDGRVGPHTIRAAEQVAEKESREPDQSPKPDAPDALV